MTPNDIQNKQFEKKMGGYRVEEVNAFLGQVAAHVQELQNEKREMEDKMAILAEKLEEYREDEDSLRAALIGAQKLGDSVVRDAKKKAEMLLAEASAKAEELVNDAKSNIDKEAIALTRMQGQVADFKSQILHMYKRHIEMINAIPDEYELPSDVKEIVDQVSVPDPEPAAAGQPESFVLTYEEGDEAMTEEERADAGSQKHKRSNYGDLRFGEEYSLTRKE